MIDEQLSQFSDLAIVVAIAVYVLAMIGFGADLAAGSQRRSDARLARREEAAGRSAAAPASAARAAEQGASSGADVTSASAVDVLETPRGPAPDAAAGPTSTASNGMSAGTFAMIMTGAGVLLHGLGVVLRGMSTHRVPWGNMYEFAMTGGFVVVAVFTVIALRHRQWRVLGTFIVAPVLILMLTAQKFWYLPAAELTPSLQNSNWLVVHVLVAILGSALFTVGAVVSALQLVQGRREAIGSTPARRRGAGALMDRLPSSADLEGLAFRIHAVAFVLWTFTLIAGSIWASRAWGRYWGWDPKEVWTFVIWVVYAAYLHARSTRGFRGKWAAWFALLGFVCLIFNFTIVNTVINGLHSYSGL